jgi:hypothetical protein
MCDEKKNDNNKCAWCEKELEGSIALCPDCYRAACLFESICIETTGATFICWTDLLKDLIPVVIAFFNRTMTDRTLKILAEEMGTIKKQKLINAQKEASTGDRSGYLEVFEKYQNNLIKRGEGELVLKDIKM